MMLLRESQRSDKRTGEISEVSKITNKIAFRVKNKWNSFNCQEKLVYIVDYPLQLILDLTIQPVDKPLMHPKQMAIYPLTYVWAIMYQMGVFWQDVSLGKDLKVKLCQLTLPIQLLVSLVVFVAWESYKPHPRIVCLSIKFLDILTTDMFHINLVDGRIS